MKVETDAKTCTYKTSIRIKWGVGSRDKDWKIDGTYHVEVHFEEY